MTSTQVALLVVILGVACVVAGVWLLAGMPWALITSGVLLIVAAVVLYDPKPSR